MKLMIALVPWSFPLNFLIRSWRRPVYSDEVEEPDYFPLRLSPEQ
jgi:hypothetical protein